MVDKFISMWKVRELADKVTNVVMNYTEIEGKVREATNDEPWGPTGPLMQELAHATFTYEHFPEVMSMLWKRMLQDNKQNWRRTYKSLLLLNYLVRNGSERVVTSAREHIYDLRSLENYSFMDENGKDQGVNVRHKVRELIDFIQDDEKVREERKKAKKNKDKYIGMSSEAMGGRFGGGYTDRYNDSSRYDDRNWYSESGRGGGGGREGGGNNHYEDEYPYDGEKEDSDHESGYNSTKRYYDKERTSPRTTPTGTASAGVAAADSKKQSNPISVKSTGPTKVPPAKPSKKIDMGAAANFGKNADLGINSPTHKSSHDEDLFSPNNNTAPAKGGGGGDLLEDLFRTCPAKSPVPGGDGLSLEDDFNPRADDNQEFGDFASAFGGAEAKPQKKEDEFADFSGAFLGGNPPVGSNANSLLLTTTPLAAPSSSNNFGPSPTINMFGSTLPVQSPAAPPAQDLLSDFSGLQINTTPLNAAVQDASECSSTPWRIKFERNVNELLRKLDDWLKITSEKDEEMISAHIRQLLQEIPPGNVENLMRLSGDDQEYFTSFAENHYSDLLEKLLKLFTKNCPQVIKDFFLLHSNVVFVTESLVILLQPELLQRNPTLTVEILQEMLKSEEIFVIAFVDLSFNENEEGNLMLNLDRQSSMVRFVQLLVTVPDRLANCLQGSVPEMLRRDIWATKLTVRTMLALYNVGKINEKEGEEVFSTVFLSLLFSRIIVDYNLERKSPVLIDSFKILRKIAEESEILRKTVEKFLLKLSRNAVEIYSFIIFSNEGDPGMILKGIVKESEAWKFAICFKIPLFSVITSVKPLVKFLAEVSEDEKTPFLQDLTRNMVNSWCSHVSIENISLQQHICISKFLISGIFTMKRMKEYKLLRDHNLLKEIKKQLHDGIPLHLNAMDSNLRAVGMITAEMIVNYIENADEENRLSFEVEKMNNIDKDLIEDLKKCGEDHPEEDLQDLDLVEMIVRVEDPLHDPVIILPKKQNLVEKKHDPPQKIAEIEDLDDLDSDDDLTPYDMTNDLPLKQVQAPKYLLDLQEALADNENLDRFEQSLTIASDLIYKQLHDNEAQLGLNLLQILISLEEKTYCKNFEQDRFGACVAICCVIPHEAAEYLSGQFYSKQTNYSVSTRILMLEILGDAAKELAKIQKPQDPMKITEDRDKITRKFTVSEPDSLGEARKVIEQRVLAKTRRFASKSPHPDQHSSVNRFSPVAGCFFWPLLHGFGRNQLLMESRGKLKNDTDTVLLTVFIRTLSILMASAQNCPQAPKFAKELFSLGAVLRFHADPAVRLVVMQMIGSILMNLPLEMLKREFQEYLVELISWLTERVGNNVVTKDPDEECKTFGRHLMVFCMNILKDN
ncbi:Telomere length regulation protein TEL2 homolog [Sergentomyia squamirostris]